jgi:hypothetical protein
LKTADHLAGFNPTMADFDDSTEIKSVSVSFDMFHGQLAPARLSRELGITGAVEFGREDNLNDAARRAWWQISSIPHVASKDVNSHLRYLLSVLLPHRETLRQHAARDRIFYVKSVFTPTYWGIGPRLSDDCVAGIASLDAKVVFALYSAVLPQIDVAIDRSRDRSSIEQLRSDRQRFQEGAVLRISCSLSYWSDSVATFDPEKVAIRLLKEFPEATVDPEDRSEAEVQRIRNFLEERRPPIERNDTKDSMLRQIQGKRRRNGPVYGFELPVGQIRIRGLMSRYTIDFWADSLLEPLLHDRIFEFLKSLNLETIEFSRQVVVRKS